MLAFYGQATESLKSIPGVESVSSISAGPQFGGSESVEFVAEGQAPSPSGDYQQGRFYDAGPGYFHTMQIPLLRGREFTDRDNASSPKVAVVNETLAKRYWPQGDALGKHLLLPRSNESLEVVGVAGDVRRYSLESQVEPEIYWPYLQQPRWATYFVLRTNQNPAGFAAPVRSRVLQTDPEVGVSGYASTMDSLIYQSLKRPRFHMVLICIFAAAALLLASVGLYGVVSYSVSRRTREMGIRLALGAQPRNLLRMVMRETLVLVFVGVVVGLLAARLAAQVLTAMLFGVSATDPVTFALITVLVVCVAALAGYVPASRAAKVDPMTALRYE